MAVTVDLDQCREWLKVSAAALPDDELQLILDAETATQADLCTITDAGTELGAQPALDAALLRRCARAAAAKGVPLGIVAQDAEYGAVRIPTWDVEIERYEGPWRKVVLA